MRLEGAILVGGLGTIWLIACGMQPGLSIGHPADAAGRASFVATSSSASHAAASRSRVTDRAGRDRFAADPGDRFPVVALVVEKTGGKKEAVAFDTNDGKVIGRVFVE